MVKLVLGVGGTIGAGKDVCTDYLKQKYKFTVLEMGDLVREELKQSNMSETRENLQFLAKKRTDEFGIGFWTRKAVKKAEDLGIKADYVAINGVRRPVDATLPKKVFGDKFKLLFVDADVAVRFKRLKERKRPGDPKTLSEFKKQEQNEWKIFDFERTMKLADFTIKNETSSVEDFHKQIDEVMAKLIK
jgi:dephospho-CoA kinase